MTEEEFYFLVNLQQACHKLIDRSRASMTMKGPVFMGFTHSNVGGKSITTDWRDFLEQVYYLDRFLEPEGKQEKQQ